MGRYKGGWSSYTGKDEVGQGSVMRMMSALDFPGGPVVKDAVQPGPGKLPQASAAKPVSSASEACAL